MGRFIKGLLIFIVVLVALISYSGNFTASQEFNNADNINDSSNSSNNSSNNSSLIVSQAINQTINTSTYKYASWGILVQELSTGEVLYDLNSNKMFVPGSTTKLFITAAALDAYGANYTFKTPVYSQGEIDSEGTLKGNLILVASGDLTMGGRNTPDGKINFTNIDHGDANALPGATLTSENPLSGLNDLARQVKDSGINKIEGNVVIDDRLFETTSSDDYVITPIMINDNLIDLEIKPGKSGANATVNWRPKTSIYSVKSNVTTVSSGEENITVNYDGKGTILVQGQIPANSTSLIRTYDVKNPAAFARSLFIEALKRQGINVTAPIKSENPVELLPSNTTYNSSDEFKEVALLTSLPFAENIKLILKVSQNEQADTLVALLAAKNGKKTFDEGMALEGNFITKSGVAENSLILSDGRGGVSSDRISPQASNQLLRYTSQQSYFPSYFNALPIMGYDGSLEGVGNNSTIYGKVQAKTGTTISDDKLNQRGVLLSKALDGYMTAKSGRKLVFSIYVNNVPLNELNEFRDIQKNMVGILEQIYEVY